VGFLRDDLIARSPDPFPVFSWLVELTHRHLNDLLFHVYYLFILALYAASCTAIADRIFPLRRDPIRAILFFALLVTAHAVPLQHAAWFLQAGMAGQYILGPVLQPSVFGVLLIASIERFLNGKANLAVALAAVAVAVHPSYALSAVALTLAYAYRTGISDRRPGAALRLALLSLCLLAPTMLYAWLTFAPTSGETARRAQEILVHFRFPHHALPAEWFGLTEIAQLALLGAGFYLVRGTALFPILLFPAIVGLLLTLVQVVSGSDALALLFPWRVSVFLVPLSTALVIGAGIRRLLARCEKIVVRRERLITAGAVATILLFASVGVAHFAAQSHKRGADRRGMIEFVRASLTPGNLYLIPTRMEDFRLGTGAAVFVDYKTHPYRDADVIEWYGRLQLADSFYRAGDSSRLAELAARGVTHIVTKAGKAPLASRDCTELYRDEDYVVHRVRGGPAHATTSDSRALARGH